MTERGKQTNTRIITPLTTGGQLVDQSPYRTALIIYPPSVGQVTVFPDSTPTLLFGRTLRSDSKPMRIWLEYDGDLVQRGWFGIGTLVGLDDAGGFSDNWTETAAAVNGVATASHAGVAGSTHFVDGISFGASASVVGIQGRLLAAAAELMRFRVFTNLVIPFTRPIEIPTGDAAVADLAATGIGNEGDVNIHGRTVLAQRMMITEVFGE